MPSPLVRRVIHCRDGARMATSAPAIAVSCSEINGQRLEPELGAVIDTCEWVPRRCARVPTRIPDTATVYCKEIASV